MGVFREKYGDGRRRLRLALFPTGGVGLGDGDGGSSDNSGQTLPALLNVFIVKIFFGAAKSGVESKLGENIHTTGCALVLGISSLGRLNMISNLKIMSCLAIPPEQDRAAIGKLSISYIGKSP